MLGEFFLSGPMQASQVPQVITVVAVCYTGSCGTRKAHVITDLLHEQLAKDLLLYCAPKSFSENFKSLKIESIK